MEWGEHEEWLAGIAEEEGEAPEALQRRPEIEPHLRLAWGAFWSLSGDRPVGAMGGCGAIPFTSIDRYAARYGIEDADDFDRFHTLIRRMDAAFIADAVQKTKTETGGAQ